jgi:hypothetical protein
MNKSKDLHMIAYSSSCREDRGRHTLRWIHSSSHDSRRRYLSNTYLEKRPIFEERAQNKRGEIIQKKFKGIQTGGAASRRVQARGAAPR